MMLCYNLATQANRREHQPPETYHIFLYESTLSYWLRLKNISVMGLVKHCQ